MATISVGAGVESGAGTAWIARGRQRWWRWVAFTCCVLSSLAVRAETLPRPGAADSRVRTAVYDGNQVYRLFAHVGYQIDLQFEAGETFVGLGAGDLEAVSFVAQDNHLFLKPRADRVDTNLTVLTTRRHYQFDYTATAELPDPTVREVLYAVRFIYPAAPASAAGVKSESAATADIEARLKEGDRQRPHNVDYWYCGHPALKPVAVSDDGVHTRLAFGARAEHPAIFVRNDDGSESLLNFSMEAGEVIVHRVARRLIVRRGRLAGCIVNKGYTGIAERLPSGTVATDVVREIQGARP